MPFAFIDYIAAQGARPDTVVSEIYARAFQNRKAFASLFFQAQAWHRGGLGVGRAGRSQEALLFQGRAWRKFKTAQSVCWIGTWLPSVSGPRDTGMNGGARGASVALQQSRRPSAGSERPSFPEPEKTAQERAAAAEPRKTHQQTKATGDVRKHAPA